MPPATPSGRRLTRPWPACRRSTAISSPATTSRTRTAPRRACGGRCCCPRCTPPRRRPAGAGPAPATTTAPGSVDAGAVLSVLKGKPPHPRSATRLPQFGSPDLRLLRRIGHVDPSSLDEYRAAGGYTSLRRALALGPDGVIREVLDAKLLG